MSEKEAKKEAKNDKTAEAEGEKEEKPKEPTCMEKFQKCIIATARVKTQIL